MVMTSGTTDCQAEEGCPGRARAIPDRFYAAKVSPGVAERFTEYEGLLRPADDVGPPAREVVARIPGEPLVDACPTYTREPREDPEITALRADGTLREISEKYFKADVSTEEGASGDMPAEHGFTKRRVPDAFDTLSKILVILFVFFVLFVESAVKVRVHGLNDRANVARQPERMVFGFGHDDLAYDPY